MNCSYSTTAATNVALRRRRSAQSTERRSTNDRCRRISASSDYVDRPVDGDPALRWKGSASPETTMTAGKPIPSRQRDPLNKGRMTGQKRALKTEGRLGQFVFACNWRAASAILRCSTSHRQQAQGL